MTDVEAIVEAHSAAVWRTPYRLLAHYEDALDCYQETFLAALRLANAQEVVHWRTLLVRIATRRAIDVLRHRYRADSAAHSLNHAVRSSSRVEAPDARVQADELLEQVRRVLATMPPQQAEAFWLRHVEHLGSDEVAQLLGIERGHVRVLVHRAAVALRTLLGPTFGPAPVSEELP